MAIGSPLQRPPFPVAHAVRGQRGGPWLIAAWVLSILGAVSTHAENAVPIQTYLEQVKPALAQRCYACHGALQQKAGLRLDTVDAMRRGGKSGPAIHPGEAARSLLWQRASDQDPEERMPPEHEGERLSPKQLSALSDWIQHGAEAPVDDSPEPDPRDHWAFRAPTRPLVPDLHPGTKPEFTRSAVDAFLEQKRAQAGVRAQPEVSRVALLRRLSFDLIGLPPSPSEMAAVEADRHPDWYERAVDRLLADPRHGQRWARHWMDIWRYSDPYGLGDQLRNSQPHLWHWRDWIVDSLNADLSYDEMVRLMLAADELHPDDLGRLRATGYLARQYFLFNRNQWMDEVVEHTGKAFLGLTLNCAKCHDHKYDPIPQEDYYRFRAFFEPYHARLDAVPETADLAKDGIPRAYDRELETPTYRFVRGQENQPDRSIAIAPGIPKLFAFAPLEIRPVSLPLTASRPELREWVIEAHATQAQDRWAEASRNLARLRANGGSTAYDPSAIADELPQTDADRDLHLATLRLGAAHAELESVRRRGAVLRASREHHPEEANLKRTAIAAVRRAEVARARFTLAQTQLRTATAQEKDRAAAHAALTEAQAALAAARATADRAPEDSPPLPPLHGAAWTPTRFADSTKDDPALPFPAQSTGRRSALATWITDRRHPLTARVAVNHVWNRHFGVPLVPNLFDFGRKSPTPRHADLLDWLAVEFMENGWSFKHLHRMIVTSAAYCMDSTGADAKDAQTIDPDNHLWWRRHSIRLEAQVIRDSLLTHAGRLDPAAGGPPVAAAEQEGSQRRSLYFAHSNNERNVFLATFDDALVKECYRREQSIVPQQALALLNSRLTADSVPQIARRIEAWGAMNNASATGSYRGFAQACFLTLLGFHPSESELSAVQDAMREWETIANSPDAQTRAREARAHLVWTLLNHHDFVTLR